MSKSFSLFNRLKNIEPIEEEQLDEISKELQKKVASEREKRADTAILKLAKTRYMAKKREEKEKQNEEVEDDSLFVESDAYGLGLVKSIHEGTSVHDSYAIVVFEHGEEVMFLEDLEKMLDESVKSLIKSFKRGMSGWGGEEDSPKELVKRNKSYSTDTLKRLKGGEGETPKKHTPRSLQIKTIARELKKRKANEEVDLDDEQLEERKHDTGWYPSKGERKDAYGNTIKRKNVAKHLAKQGAAEAEDGKDHSDGEPDDAVKTRAGMAKAKNLANLGRAQGLAKKGMKANEEKDLVDATSKAIAEALRTKRNF